MLVGGVGGGGRYIPGPCGFLVLWKRRRRMTRLKLSIAGFYGTRWGTFAEICLHSTASRPNHLPPVPGHLARLGRTPAPPPGHPRDPGRTPLAFFKRETSGERNNNSGGNGGGHSWRPRGDGE